MKKIMIVEDDKDICRELKEMLDHAGYEGVVLSDFHNGCRQILKAKPDLVLLDINIPFQNGEMLLKELRESSDVPVIMVTSRESEADEVMRSGRMIILSNLTIRLFYFCGSTPSSGG